MKRKPNNKRYDFISNRLNKYSIRKFTVGTTSILIGSLMFLGNSADAAETTTTTTDTTANPATDNPTTEAPATAAVTTEAAITEAPTTEASTTEAVNTPVQAQNLEFNADNTELTGIATSGQVVELHLADGTIEKTVVDTDGTFIFRSLTVASEEVVSVITVDRDVKSEAVKVTANKIVEATTEAPTTEAPTTEAATTETATTEAPTTEAATTETATTEAATTETATTEAPTTEAPTTEIVTTEAPVVTPDVATAPETTEVTTSVADTTAALNTATTDAEKQQALADTVVSNTGITQEEASAYVANLNLDYANLTNEELTALLLQAIADSQAANQLPVLVPTTDSSLTNAESLALSANAVETTGTSPMTLSTLALGDTSNINTLAASTTLQDQIQADAIYAPGDPTKKQTYSGTAWIYKNGTHSNPSQIDAEPLGGANVYLQWVNGDGYVSKVYYTTTNADGSFAIDLSKPETDALGNTYSFQLAGDANFAVRTWVENPDPENLDVIKHGDQMYGFHTRLERKNEAWNFTAGVNRIVNSQVVLQEKHNNVDYLLKPEAERTISPNADGTFTNTGIYGTVRGNVWYENGDGPGTLANQWIKDASDINATGVKVAASYVNDNVTKLFDTWKLNNIGYKLEDFKAAQAQIIADYQKANGVGSHIAETVVATVAADGSYYIPFNGLYGISPYVKGSTITPEQYGTVVTAADVSHNNLMAWNGTLGQKHRHINEEYMYVSPLINDYAIWSDNFQTNMFENAADSLTFSLSSDNISSVDFALLAPQPMHDVLVYDSSSNFATIGTTVESTTGGLLPSREYQVQWFKDGVAFGSPITMVSTPDGTVGSYPVTVPDDITAPTNFTSAVFLPNDDTTSLANALAADSFTVIPLETPSLLPVDNNDTVINIAGTANSTVTVTDSNGNVLGTVVMPADGTNGSLVLSAPLAENTVLTATATLETFTTPTSEPITVVDVLSAIPSQTVEAGNPIADIVISNNDVGTPNDSTITVSTLPDGLTFDPATNTISGTPTKFGNYEITVTATDANGGITTETFTISVVDTTLPTVDASDATVTEGQEITPIPVTITDDSDTTEEVTGLPSGLTYDDENNQIVGTPDVITDWNDDAATGTYEETRDYPVTITVTDEAGNVTEETIIITV
ncbi:YSIRK-type signal peptide-containing protein, partial [Macrococcoides goetzii]